MLADEMVTRTALREPNPSGGSFATSMGALTAPSTVFPDAFSEIEKR